MADILGGGPAVSNGNGASSSRPTAPPTQTGSPSRGIRGPRMIMQERAEREARRAEREREEMERLRAEEQARAVEEQRQMMEQERRRARETSAAAGAAPGGGASIHPIDTQSSGGGGDAAPRRRQQRAEAQSAARPAAGASQIPTTPQTTHQRPARGAGATQAPPAPDTFSGGGGGGGGGGVPPTGGPPPTAGQPGESSAAGAGRPRNSFPHAFERWEALSAHWEGLTSFWIRQLQQRSDEINRDPLSQQLARQVTDLSAAGANLFHAVVELQRLRASSERKFQRWFFDTRADLERREEEKGMLQAALYEEQRGRADAIRDAVKNEQFNSQTQKQLAEMRKELLISKEEARRAWEELGRREQEERDRTLSLQNGLPTVVGGVQVVPMTQGVPSRHGSTREPRTPGGGQAESSRHHQEPAEYAQSPSSRPHVAPTASTAHDPSTGRYYQQQQQQQQQQHQYQQPPQAAAHHQEEYGAGGGSEAGYSEGEYAVDAHGNFIRDAHGRKIPFRAAASPGDDQSDDGGVEYETPGSHPGTSYPPSSSHHYYQGGAPAPPQDYSGQGYAAPGWETVPRHHHPTRLSDVIEEDDERSRTSASQVSRGH